MTAGAPPTVDQRAAERADFVAMSADQPAERLLLRYQKRTTAKLLAGTALLVIEKSRRIGLTWGLAFYAAQRAALRASDGGDNVFYMGYEQEMAREFIEACAMWLKVLGIVADAYDEEIIDDEEKGAIRAFRIVCGSGFKIVALPSMPRAFRGKQGVVIIDEAAFHGQLEEKIKSALALLMWGGQVIIVSTHDGLTNPFNQLIDEIRAGRRSGEIVTITFDQAVEDGLYDRIAEKAAATGKSVPPKAQWIADIRSFYGDNAGEELDVIPKAGSGSLIKPGDLAACEHEDAGKPELYTSGLYRIGRDVARRRDGQIILGFESVGDVEWLRDEYNETGQTFAHQDAFFNDLFRKRRVVQAGVDQTGMGEKVVEDLQLLHGTTRVQGFLLTGPMRLAIGISLATRFERGLIRVPPRPDIRADLLAIKRASTAGGGVRLVNDDTVHADWFWAAGIASFLADSPPSLYAYTPVPRDGRRPDIEEDRRRGFRGGEPKPGDGARFRRTGAW